MKEIMSSFLVLALPDFSKPFVLDCDASGEGIEAILMQERYPISYESIKLQPHERLYSIYDKEMLDIMHALAKFQWYLVGDKFIVKTDHNSLRHFLTQKELNDRQHKWVNKVQYYEFNVEYKKGNMNVVVDALSRKPTVSLLQMLTECTRYNWELNTKKNQFACGILDGEI